MSKVELPKAYEAKQVEDKIYQKWQDSGFFNPDSLPGDRPESFTISMPPPNATGTLHTGHATMLAIQDLMTRYQRMKGKKALWVPGTDHASIATQTKVEKILAKEGQTRHDLGREKFLARVAEFVENSRDTIKGQTKKMGSSCDWSRERFTLDDGLNLAVREAFTRMYNDGLIYRGYRIVNWCPRCQSTLADDEVEYKDQKGKFYYFKYGPFQVATTRPETKIGDTALAVNPEDARYRSYIGQDLEVDFGKVKVKVKVIGDEAVDPAFGTGVVGVTPAHSQVDYQMALKNNLPIIQVIGQDGKMTAAAGPYAGLTVEECRESFINDLKSAGLFIKEEDIENNLSVCYRCETLVEPLTSEQWFVAVDKKFKLRDKNKLKWASDEATLKELSIHVVKSGLIKIIPEKFEKVYFHWLENLHDWCISRQIWYGHRIPVWTKDGETYVGQNAPEGVGWQQDEDTLDTWFSSALWTFSTLGWPEETKDLKVFHPTTVMETGYDILFFWVARMIIMTVYCLNDIPFENVYLHGLVRAEDGRKMSKSLDNALDPLEVIEKYGTDALRLSMLIGVTPGNDFKLFDEKIGGFRNFVNKLWNISRFVLQEVAEIKLVEAPPSATTLADKWILHRLSLVIKNIEKNLDNFQFSAAGEALQHFTWNDFADWYLEIAKIEKGKDDILLHVLQTILKLWHPYCPFVTEELWKNFNAGMLMISAWPNLVEAADWSSATDDFELVQNVITAIRNLRGENKVEPAKLAKVVIITQSRQALLESQSAIIKKLGRLEELSVSADVSDKPSGSVGTVLSDIEIYLDLAGLVDIKAEKKRLTKEIAETENYFKGLKAKLSNAEFVDNAPSAVVAKEKEKLSIAQEKVAKLQEQLNNLN
ncbi:MAG: valine--tRNA ligase [Patescibacteria group bacterium]